MNLLSPVVAGVQRYRVSHLIVEATVGLGTVGSLFTFLCFYPGIELYTAYRPLVFPIFAPERLIWPHSCDGAH